MDGALSIVAGLVLALLGARSIRLLFFASGFGLGWLLAAAFSASAMVSLLAGVAGGVSAFVLGLVAARVAFFAIGAVVGAVVGARLFAIVDRSDSNVLLALLFVPAVAICAGVAVQRWRAGFLRWVTAVSSHTPWDCWRTRRRRPHSCSPPGCGSCSPSWREAPSAASPRETRALDAPVTRPALMSLTCAGLPGMAQRRQRPTPDRGPAAAHRSPALKVRGR
jgi:hypothetical protein